jgi:hypothetical protein
MGPNLNMLCRLSDGVRLLVRQIFQAKYSRGDELVALFREFATHAREAGWPVDNNRILTDASGSFSGW